VTTRHKREEWTVSVLLMRVRRRERDPRPISNFQTCVNNTNIIISILFFLWVLRVLRGKIQGPPLTCCWWDGCKVL